MPLVDTIETYQMTNVGDHIDGTDVYQTNPNLLDNPWFTINQRGQSSYTTASFGVDRWTFSNSDSNHTITINADKSVTISGLFYQKKEYDLQVGEAVTISYMTADGNIVSRTGTIPASQGFAVGSSDFGLYWRTTGVADFQIWATNLNLRAVKLEKGTVSTLANDVAPDYATELDKCLLYCEVVDNTSTSNRITLGVGDSVSAGSIYMPIKLHPKRKISFASLPNPVVTGSVSYGEHSPSDTATSVNWFAFDPNSGFGTLQIQGSNIAANTRYRVLLNQSSKIVFSADL